MVIQRMMMVSFRRGLGFGVIRGMRVMMAVSCVRMRRFFRLSMRRIRMGMRNSVVQVQHRKEQREADPEESHALTV